VPSVRVCSARACPCRRKRSTSGRTCPAATASRTARRQPWESPRTGLRPRSARASGPGPHAGHRVERVAGVGAAKTFSATPHTFTRVHELRLGQAA
jgi:hypothetical protein